MREKKALSRKSQKVLTKLDQVKSAKEFDEVITLRE